jgi:hypothetical protein
MPSVPMEMPSDTPMVLNLRESSGGGEVMEHGQAGPPGGG